MSTKTKTPKAPRKQCAASARPQGGGRPPTDGKDGAGRTRATTAIVNLKGVKRLGISSKEPTTVLCSWCAKPATAYGEDGSWSCGQGQGDGLESHNKKGVLYTPVALLKEDAWTRT